MKQRGLKLLIFSVLLLSILVSNFILSVSADNSKTVLILNSYHKGLAWTDQETEGIINELNDKYPNCNIKIEYLDWKNYPNEDNLNFNYNLYKYKYSNSKIDLIITTDDAALDFATKNRMEIFSDAPIVFCGVNQEGIDMLMTNHRNVTGVISAVNPMETVKRALEIMPSMKRIYILYDNTESGVSTGKLTEEAVKKVSPGTEIISLNNKSLDELIKDVRNAPKDSVILITVYYVDAAGMNIGFEAFTEIVSKNSSVPVFNLYDFSMGHGAIGGNLLSGRLQGEGAGKLAVRVLNGEAISDIPIQKYAATYNTFDYFQLDRFRIPLSKLPKDSIIINKPFSFFETYKSLVILVVACFFILIAFITILLAYISKINRMKRLLYGKNEELTQLYEELTASDEELQQQLDELSATQQSLLVSEERYSLVSQAANDAIWDLDVKNNNEYISDRWYEIFGYTVEEYEQIKPWYNLVHPEDLVEVNQEITKSLGKNIDHYKGEMRVKTKNGEYRWVLARAKLIFDGVGQVTRIAITQTDITELKESEQKLHKLAYYDVLTGLQNRESLSNKLSKLLEADDNKRYALLFIDVDNFKYINDTKGHYFGDLLISSLGKRLGSLAADYASIYRLGGDEFVILLENCESLEEIDRFADNIVKAAKEPFVVEDITINITLSVGAAVYPDHVSDKKELMKSADIAMYRAKEEGKDKYIYYNSVMQESVIERMEIEKNLRTALENNEFTLNYQPQVDTTTKKVVGFEALLRWNSPELGLVSPAKFIKVAEDIQLIIPLGFWVLENACRFLKAIQQMGYYNYKMSINLSVIQVMKDDFVDRVMQIIKSFDINPECIELEVTETVLAESFLIICEKLNLLRQRGVRIALDDFGKGYSSLNYLNQLPITTLKIDKVFIDNIRVEKSSKSLLRMIVMIGREMGLSIIAEGVETAEQFEFLESIECNNIQGYLFYKPMPEKQILEMIKSGDILPKDI